MTYIKEPSVEDLRQESERARAALATTVVQLRNKVGDSASQLKTMASPSYLKQEIKNYVREERESFTRSLQRKAKDNPLQVAAVGAALAYPALALIRAIPIPLMLIGAGLFLTSQRGRRTAKDIGDKVGGAVQSGTGKMSELAGSIGSGIDEGVTQARASFHDAGDAVASRASTVAGAARTAIDNTTAKVKDLAESVKGQFADSTPGQAAFEGHAASVEPNLRKLAVDFVNDNALLVAGIGVAVGAFVAASIPSSAAEDRLFGAGSNKLKGKVRETAAQGMDKAGEFVAASASSIAAAAAREGLDETGLHGAVNSVIDGVRSVADRSVDAALNSGPRSTQHTITERNAT